MFQVKNKEALRLLAGRQMKKSRQRNAIAIGAIVLTTILFSTLFTVGGGVLEQAQQTMMRANGSTGQASFKYLSMPEYEKVKEAGGYEGIGYSILTGVGADERLQKLPTEVRYGEDYMAKSFLDYPTEGHMPEKKMELATSRLVLDAMGLSDELGSQFVFPIEVDGTLHEDTFTLCGVWDGDSLAPAQQAWVSESYSGEVAPVRMNRWDGDADTLCYGGSICAEVDFSNTWNLPEKMADLLERAGLPADTEIGINPVYTEFQIDPSLIFGMILLLAAVLVSGYLIIYNVFYISVTQDIQFYGLLKTIGASGKQLRRIVFRQAAVLSCAGVPVGLLAGYMVGKVLLPFVVMQFNMKGFDEGAVSPLVLVGAAVFSLLTVWISFRSPGRIAASVSPVEAVRYTGQARKKSRKKGKSTNGSNRVSRKQPKMQNGKWHSKRFSTAGMLGLRNLRRDGKKAVLVILSLFLSMTLLNTTYTILRGFDLERFAESQSNGDFEVTDWSIGSMALGDMDKKNLEGIDAEFEETVSRMPGLERFDKVYCEQGKVQLSKEIQEWIKEMIDQGNNPSFFEYITEDEFIFSYAATGSLVEQIEYKEGTFEPEKWAQGTYVIYDDVYGHSETFYRPGDQIILEGKDGQKKEYTVMAVGHLPYTLTSRMYINLTMSVILPEQEFVELYGEKQPLSVVYDVEESCREEAEKETARLAESSDKIYTSYETLKQEFEQTKRAYSLIGGILSLILGAIGILNFVNIVVTGILARQKELAMLSAVGMGGRQMKKMLIWESGAYIGSAAVLTVTAGNLLSWLICQNETIRNQWAFVYHFTVLPVAVCLPVLIAAASAVPLVFYRQLCKKSVVERLRYV